MEIEDLIRKTRSCRRFHQDRPVEIDTLKSLVNLARLSASARNLQPLKYILSTDGEQNSRIFPCLKWAAYLTDWPGPKEGERPSAYIIMVGDTEITKNFDQDPGIAAWSILLGAREKGLGGCMMEAIDKKRLCSILNLEERYDIRMVVSLGDPREQVVIDPVKDDGSIRYWRDEKEIHHVPKRHLPDIILKCYSINEKSCARP